MLINKLTIALIAGLLAATAPFAASAMDHAEKKEEAPKCKEGDKTCKEEGKEDDSHDEHKDGAHH